MQPGFFRAHAVGQIAFMAAALAAVIAYFTGARDILRGLFIGDAKAVGEFLFLWGK